MIMVGSNDIGRSARFRAALRLSLLLLLAITPLHVLAKRNAVLVAPVMEGPTQVEFSTEQTSKWTDLPMGTYRVPDSDVIISGHQKGGAAPALLFGVVGMAIQGSVNKGNGKEAMASSEKALTFSIDDEAKATLLRLMAEGDNAGKFTAEPTDRKFELTGAVVLSFANQAEALPYVTLRVKLLDAKGKKLWTTRYIASEGARKPVVGDGSWTADEGAPLRTHVSKMLELAIRTMLTDVANPYPRDEASLVTVRGFFPHVNKPLQVVGYKLAEENGRMLFLPNLGTTIVFAGVNILDAATVSYTPTVKGDKPLKLLKPDDPSLPALARASEASVVASAEASASIAAEPGVGEVAQEVDAAGIPADVDAEQEDQDDGDTDPAGLQDGLSETPSE